MMTQTERWLRVYDYNLAKTRDRVRAELAADRATYGLIGHRVSECGGRCRFHRMHG